MNSWLPEDFRNILSISRREVQAFSHRPLFLFTIILAPVVVVIFFTTLMGAGLPTKLPAAMVDEDNTKVTRELGRILASMQETRFDYYFDNFEDARKAMQAGKIYGFFYIPKGTTRKAMSSRQPTISFYTNEAYLVPGSLLMRDFKTMGELSGLAVTREGLYARGATEHQAYGIFQGIVLETHPLGNSVLDYSVYLTNMLVPGLFIILILLAATYTLGYEWKQETQKQWLAMAGGSRIVALTGKLMPQLLLFQLMFVGYDVYVFKILQFPCNCGIEMMILWSLFTVIATQAFAIFMFGLFAGKMRLSMCMCSLWGILSFSIAGFSFPVTAMSPVLQGLAFLFPLRHYYLIYVNQALYGFSIHYVWTSVAALLGFTFLPLLVMHRYKAAFDHIKYRA